MSHCVTWRVVYLIAGDRLIVLVHITRFFYLFQDLR